MAAASRVALATAQESPLMTGGSTLSPAGGASAWVYQHNTTTPVSVFAGETGAGTLTQPLLADANGLLPGWVAGGQDLDIVATFGGQTLTQQIEPVIASNAAAAGVTYVDPPTGVAATDTLAWHAARDLAGTGGTVQGRPGTYVVNGLNATLGGQWWKFAGCTIITASGTNAPILTTTAPVILEGPGTLDGNGAVNTGSSTLGIWLNTGSVGSIVRDLTVQNTYQAGIYSYVGGVTLQRNTVLNTVLGPAIYSQPGTLADLSDIRVLDNTVDKSSQSPATAQGYGIQLHGGPAGSTFTATTSTVTNPTVLTAVSSFTNLAVGLAISGTGIPVGATIASLNAGASTLTMTLPATATGTAVTISVNYSLRGLVVSRNKVKLALSPTTTALGIECWGGTPGAIVSENRVSGGQMGISLDRSDNGTVIGNSTENYTQQGIEIANCTGVTVNGNTIDGSVRGGGGITLDGLLTPTTKSTVVGNAITRVTNIGGQSGKAIFVISNGDHCTIIGNAVTVNSGLNTAGVYVQNSPSTAVLCNMLYCYSSVANDAVVFEGSSSGGGVVLGNVIEGWPRNAVSLFAGTAQTIDRIILGPNVLNNNGGIFGAVGSAVIGNLCRFTYTEQSQAGPAVSSITVGASPFTYTNTDHNPIMLYITGGTVSAVAKNSINIFTASPCTVHMEPGDSVTVTASVLPSMRKDPL